MQDVAYKLCEQMVMRYGAGFIEEQILGGVRLWGECVTRTGEILTIFVDVYMDFISLRVIDQFKRILFMQNVMNSNDLSGIFRFMDARMDSLSF